MFVMESRLSGPQRAYSTTTRIKTLHRLTIFTISNNLREHIPLQQGLRQYYSYSPLQQKTQRAYSTTTRIKTDLLTSLALISTLREHIPLQQGLRP